MTEENEKVAEEAMNLMPIIKTKHGIITPLIEEEKSKSKSKSKSKEAEKDDDSENTVC